MALTDREIAKYLRAAADYLRPEGRWVKGRLFVYKKGDMETPAVCAVGAIMAVTSGSRQVGMLRPKQTALLRHLDAQLFPLAKGRRLVGDMQHGVMSFNDSRRRKKNEVIALFERTAEAVELRAAITERPAPRRLKASSLELEAPVKVKS